MKNFNVSNFKFFVFGFFVVLPWILNAAKFTGFKQTSGTKSMRFVESVERFIETKTDFLILFSHHPAFYRFPKIKERELEVKDFLNSRIKSQEKLNVEFDPTTVKILVIEDAEKSKAHK